MPQVRGGPINREQVRRAIRAKKTELEMVRRVHADHTVLVGALSARLDAIELEIFNLQMQMPRARGAARVKK